MSWRPEPVGVIVAVSLTECSPFDGRSRRFELNTTMRLLIAIMTAAISGVMTLVIASGSAITL